MRQDWLDLTKGIAILLVVIGHVFRGYTAAGLFPEYQTAFAYIDYTIYSFHMPLFFLLSGYLYRQREGLLPELAKHRYGCGGCEGVVRDARVTF